MWVGDLTEMVIIKKKKKRKEDPSKFKRLSFPKKKFNPVNFKLLLILGE